MKDTLEGKMQDPSLESPKRREFLRKACLAGIAGFAMLTGCAGAQTDLKDPSKFDLKAFMSWYRKNKLYNGPNPNLRSPHSVADNFRGPTFKSSIDSGYTPGIGYSVPSGEVMVAVAPGVVSEIGEITGTGRAGGMYIEINHPVGGPFSPSPYLSNFSHISEPYVKGLQEVKRGQPICAVPSEHRENAKLIFREWGNHVDPDNYGPHYSYMQYDSPPIEQDKATPLVMDNMLREQSRLVSRLDNLRKDWERTKTLLNSLWHNEHGYKPSQWSVVEKFRFFETLYEMHPYQFPTLVKEEFETIRKEFYENQPIILTLPFKKGGLR